MGVGRLTVQLGSVRFASIRSSVGGGGSVSSSSSSLGGVGVTGVQASLCGRGGVAVVGGQRGAVEGLCAPPQVLQRLQEGASCPLLLQRRGALLLYLGDLGEGDGLRLEAGLAGPTGAALAPGGALGDGQLLGELLHGRGQQVGRQDVKARGLRGHLTHSSHTVRWDLVPKPRGNSLLVET